MRISILAGVIAVVAAPSLPTALAADTATVFITDSLSPARLEVDTGTIVTFKNDDSERHRMRTQSGPDQFDVDLDPGQSASVTLSIAGTYSYLDERDDENTDYYGTIVVGSTPDTGGGGSGGTVVDMLNERFLPATISVPAGTTIRFTNSDDRPHSATARDRSWDTGIFDTGGARNIAFPTPGTFDYFCVLHPDMIGTVIVTGTGGGGATTTTTLPPTPPTTTPPTTPPAGSIGIGDNFYSPSSRTIEAGTTVTWVNAGDLPHTVTRSGSFDSGILMPGDTYTRTFTTSGTFDYFCIIHPSMTGTIVVTTAGPGDTTTTTQPGEPGSEDPGSSPPTTSPPARSGDVSIGDNFYSPSTRTVRTGSTVTWVNSGDLPHTVTRSGSFDSGILMPGDTYRRTFSSAGTYQYLCTLHPGMVGTIVVEDGSGIPPPTDDPTNDGEVAPDEEPTEHANDAGTVIGTISTGVEIIDNAYRPDPVEVVVGTTVSWTNLGQLPHTVTARDGSFDSGFLITGDAWSRTFEVVGTFEYFCIIHPDMVGTILVIDAPTVADADLQPGPDSSIAVDSNETTAAGVVGGGGAGGISTEAALVIGFSFLLGAVGLVSAMSWFERSTGA